MRVFLFVFLFVLCADAPCIAAGNTVIYYLDGAKVGFETSYSNGYSEIHLPKGTLADSLRIKPLGVAEIERVEIRRSKTDSKASKEMTALAERRTQLLDRLKALETREEIFKAAAKSQSSRAPRKTKNNSEPVACIRRGTDFAINQLESVYTIRRKTEKEIAFLDSRISSVQRANAPEGFFCVVWLSANKGRVHVSYLTAEQNWKPAYDFRLSEDGRVEVIMRADFPCPEKGTSVMVVPAKISEAGDHQLKPLALSKPFEKICKFAFPVENQSLSGGPFGSLTFTFNNQSGQYLPPGESACYLRGEYLGHGQFKGMKPKETGTLSYGVLAGH